MKTVSVIGLGYIGLPTAIALGRSGYIVSGYDIDEEKVARIRAGAIMQEEPGLGKALSQVQMSGAFSAATELAEADVFLVCVPTPLQADNSPALHYVEAAVKSIAGVLKAGNLIVLESTVPVGETESLVKLLKQLRPDLAFAGDSVSEQPPVLVAHCPERVLPGIVLTELIENARVVGGVDEASTAMAANFYRSWVQGEVYPVTARTAEMTKLAENSFRDVNIAFANELKLLCDAANVDVNRVIEMANHHPRVHILRPGIGVGGHCIPVDPWFLASQFPGMAKLIQTARAVNRDVTFRVADFIESLAARSVAPVVACLGLSYKAGVGDLRESPALEIAEHLSRRLNSRILAVDPYVTALPPTAASGLQLTTLADAIAEATIVVGLVPHATFQDCIHMGTEGQTWIDAAGLWAHDLAEKSKVGFTRVSWSRTLA